MRYRYLIEYAKRFLYNTYDYYHYQLFEAYKLNLGWLEKRNPPVLLE